MRATVRRWGNSLALRIPSGLAEDAHLRDGAEVDLTVEGGRLIVAPVLAPELSIDALVAAITPENVHGEQFTEEPHGAEGW